MIPNKLNFNQLLSTDLYIVFLMYNSRLIKELKSLNSSEIRRFSAFLSSAFFGFNEKTVRLGSYLIDLHPVFPESALSKESLHHKLFGEEIPYQDQRIHDQFSALNSCFRQFLAQLQYEQDERKQEFYTMKAFAEKGMTDEVSRVLRKAEKKLMEKKTASPDGYLDLYLFHYQASSVFQSRTIKKNKDRFGEMVSDLDRFYFSSKLKYACEMLNRQAIFNIVYDQQLTDRLISYLYEQGNVLLEDPLIAVYSQIYLLLKQASDRAYQDTLASLNQHQQRLSKQETASMYAFLQNYCIKQLNAGATTYLGELFRLYQILLEQKLLIDKRGHISHAHVKNIVAVGLRLRSYKWVKDFIESYKSKVPENQREDVYHYNLAQYHYEQRQFRQALKLLIQINYTDVFYQLDARALQMKIYYELGEDDSLSYFVKAFKTYLKRNQELSRSQYGPYENLIKLSQKAYRLKMKKHLMPAQKFEEKWLKLSQTIESTHGIANLHWLKRKMDELRDSV